MRMRRTVLPSLLTSAAIALSIAACAASEGRSETAPADVAAAAGDETSEQDATDTPVLFVLRHAETPKPPAPDPGPDPELTDAGAERAERLAGLLADAGITRILSTDYIRTRSTVAPLAAALGLRVERYDPRALGDLAAELGAGAERTVVVGHSNTTPALVSALGGEPGEPVDDATEFDRLYVVTIGGEVSTVLLRY